MKGESFKILINILDHYTFIILKTELNIGMQIQHRNELRVELYNCLVNVLSCARQTCQ